MKNKILIVDDDADISEAMKMVLESNNYIVDIAHNGTGGLEKLNIFNPDLIILDIMMDELTEGFHVAYKIRSDDADSPYAAWKNVPIIVVTAIHQVTPFRFSNKTDAEYLPVNEFIEKPIQPKDLLEIISKYLN